MYSLLPLLSLVVPIFTGVLCLFTSLFWFLADFSKKFAKIALLVGAALTLATVLTMVPDVLAGGVLETPELSLRADLTNTAAMAAVALIFFLASLYNVKAEPGGRLKPGLYNFFLLLFLSCMLGLLLSHDLFGIFVFVELVVGVSVILVAHNPSKLSPEAAFKYFIIIAISALFVLLGTMTVFLLTGTSNLDVILHDPEVHTLLLQRPQWLMLAVACFIVGIGADVGLVPFHGWVPDVFPASTIVINGFFSAEPVALLLALYKLVVPFYAVYPSPLIIAFMMGLGLISMVFGVLLAYPQRDFYRMMAYCSIDEFGHIVFVLGLLTPTLSLVAGQYYLINSALMKAGLILSLGSVFFTSGTPNMRSLGGLVKKMNKTAVSYLICALSLAGLPPLSGFYAKWLLYNAVYAFLVSTVGLSVAIVAVVMLVGVSMIAFVFLVRAFQLIFLGEESDRLKPATEVHVTMWLPTMILAIVAIVVGLQPQLLIGLVGGS